MENKLELLIQTLCNGNKAEFARMIQVKPQAITNWMSRGLSRSATTKITKTFPEVNAVWLLTGEGEMLKTTGKAIATFHPDFKEEREVMVPLIHIDSVGGVFSKNELVSSEQYTMGLVPFPNARPGDVAIMQSGDSMSPTIPAGSILQIRKVEDWREYFGYGNVYVLWLQDDRRITKLVKRYDEDPRHYILCCSYNPEAADEELPKSFIREVWKVVNVLVNKGW